MTKSEAEQYLYQTSWHELVRMTSGQPIPEDVDRKRKEAYEVLDKAE